MALLTNSQSLYSAIGKREDLTDLIHNISPVETWFTSNTGNVDGTNKLHEWQTDALAAAAANAQLEGDDSYAVTAITPTARLGNYMQILRKVWALTGSNIKATAAGRTSEEAYQKTIKLKELATDIEYALVVNSATAAGATGTARQMVGAIGAIATNVTTATATGLDITETEFNDNLALIWAQGGKPSHTIVGAYQKRKISAFTGGNTRFQNVGNNTLDASIDYYRSDFGNIQIHLHYIMNSAAPGTVLNFGQMEMWRKAWFRRPFTDELAKTGDNKKFHAIAELSLEYGNEKSAGKMTGYKSA